MNIQELRELTEEELKRRLIECRRDYFQLQVRFTSEQVENPCLKRDMKREMARIKTIMQ